MTKKLITHITRENVIKGTTEEPPVSLKPEFTGQVYIGSTDKVFIGDISKNKWIENVNLDTLMYNVRELEEAIDLKRPKSVKITKDDMDTSHNSRKLGLVNLSDEVISAMSGTSPVLPTIQDGSITNEKYADGSISGNKTDFLTPSKNLYDEQSKTVGYYVSEHSGLLQKYENYNTSDFIPVQGGTTLAITICRKVCFYDSSKALVKGIDVTQSIPLTFEVPVNGYVRVSFDKKYTKSQIEVGTTHTEYVPFGYELGTDTRPLVVTDKNLGDNSISGTVIQDESIGLDKVNFVQQLNNLFDYTSSENVHKHMVSHSTSNDDLVENEPYSTSGFIKVPGDCRIMIRGVRIVKTYNSHKQPLGVDASFKGTPEFKYLSKDCGYIRITYYTDRENITQVSISDSDEIIPYVPYGFTFKNDSELIPTERLAPINGRHIKGGTINHWSTNFIRCGKNLLNPNNVLVGVVNPNTGVITPDNTNTYYTTDLIPVTKGTYYFIRNARQYALYDNQGVFIKGLDLGGNKACKVEVEQDGYIRVTYIQSNHSINQIEIGESFTSYEPYTLIIDNLNDNGTNEKIDSVKDNVIKGLKKNTPREQLDFMESINLLDLNAKREGLYLANGKIDTTSATGVSYYHIPNIRLHKGQVYTVAYVRQLYIEDLFGNYKGKLLEIPGDKNDVVTFTAEDDYLAIINVRKSYINNEGLIPQLQKGETLTSLKEPYKLTIPQLKVSASQVEDLDTVVGSSWNSVDLSNVDRIGFIGDSYTDSHYTPIGKAYINKLSLFSDYNFENMAVSGDTYRGQLDKIRNGSCKYHSKLSWKDFRPKYGVLISYTNDLKYMNHEQYGNDLRAVIETIQHLGTKPIIATEYHKNHGDGLTLLLSQIAKEYDCELMNILPTCFYNNNQLHSQFWGGSHPGVRANELISNPIEKHLKNLPRPVQSMKIFRPRNPQLSRDELKFHTNIERARLFKEINVGHSALKDPKYYDQLHNYSSNGVITSEYLKLQNKEDVSFTNFALVDTILPSTSTHIEDLRIKLSNTDVKVWVKDILKSPYALPQYYRRFDVPNADSHNLTIGDKYYSDTYPSKTLTLHHIVKGIGDGGGDALFFSPNDMNISTRGGNLIKVSGNGSDTIPYTYSSVGFDESYPVGKQTIGNWVELTLEDGYFTIPKDLLNKCVNHDKLTILIEKSGNFNLNDIRIDWKGEANKPVTGKPFKPVVYRGAELITNTLVGNNTNNWTTTGSITPFVPEDSRLPLHNTTCIEVSDTKTIKTTVNFEDTANLGMENPVSLKVIGRFFPPVFNPNTQSYPQDSRITEDSFDYVEVFVDVDVEGKVFTFSDIVGMHWKDIEFNFDLPVGASSMSLKVYTKDEAIQVAQVSLRHLN